MCPWAITLMERGRGGFFLPMGMEIGAILCPSCKRALAWVSSICARLAHLPVDHADKWAHRSHLSITPSAASRCSLASPTQLQIHPQSISSHLPPEVASCHSPPSLLRSPPLAALPLVLAVIAARLPPSCGRRRHSCPSLQWPPSQLLASLPPVAVVAAHLPPSSCRCRLPPSLP